MITLTINGQKIQSQEGQSILEVCRKNNVAVPSLCYHPVLEPYGACRMCTVEVTRKGQSWSTLQTACTHPAWDGLDVQTDSRQINLARHRKALDLQDDRNHHLHVHRRQDPLARGYQPGRRRGDD